jgi:transposase InsO family protein
VDVASRYVVLKALESKHAECAAEALCNTIVNYGIPKTVQSDQGTEFVNNTIEFMKKKIGFNHQLTTPYVSFQNGLVERNVQTVSMALRRMTEEMIGGLENWPFVLGAVQMAMNSRFTTVHNIQPFTLMFGRQPNQFEEYENHSGEGCETEDIQSVFLRWLDIYQNTYPDTQLSLKTKQNEMKKRVDNNRIIKINDHEKGNEFSIGSIVRWKDPHRKDKWSDEFIGPAKIKSVNRRTGNYTLCEVDDNEALLANNIPSHSLRLTSELGRGV